MTEILVLGIGSPFGTDNVGWMVIDKLEKIKNAHPERYGNLSLHSLSRSDTGILELLSDYQYCIIIDAVILNGDSFSAQDFRVREVGLEEIDTCPDKFSSHGFGLGATLQLGKAMNMLPGKLEILGLEIPAIWENGMDLYLEPLTNIAVDAVLENSTNDQ